ncbi:FprA family A-type flavoprotein [Clostridium sp. 19966]|uniref:FprA family A-type flavoprotein n=1 Tax=Clostridium sp. 19966 TaxID=2768166 RepID=UPI0028DF2CE6|nr:FprA family A-type flavoprotein [Clostridium sp. 19966]MDT8716113.1 FprA family A-type flavoprotein [Clostridium sp. 19966]
MKSLEIKKDIYWVGALDPGLRIFDIIMYTPYGTTYNSYVVRGSEKVAVIETVKEQFFDQYLERLNSLDVDVTKIDYIVVDHTEPDHAGSVAKLLKLSPNAKVVGSPAALRFVKKIANCDFDSIIAKGGSSLDLGNKTLKFIEAPFLHWPDSIYTYLEEDKILFTCDSFGCHYCNDKIYDDLNENQENYMEALRYYFDCIMGPFKPYVLKAVDKIKDLDIEMICNGHGPILRQDPWKIVNLYKEWSTPAAKQTDKAKVVIPYVSAYGYTEILANKIAEGIKSTGDFDITLYNVIHSDMKKILEDIDAADGVLFGSPTINSDLLEPISEILTKLNPLVHGGKVAAGFGSYGWSGEAVPNIEQRLKQLRMKIQPGLKICFKPSEEDLKQTFEFGEEFGKRVLVKLGKLSPDSLEVYTDEKKKC